ncbi:lipopolysaccharide biosynthesis protein WzzE [Bisgaardia hudsonensis]|uniref:Lipopolysaccharide biosynthesis protein WzzE n=1 Tax=Bisgaardia hudsonensis TaxID=109472 RepID=A0A4R2MTX6_9PAST|nr:hypothetical protein [Bisgaardia hudsonensis]QLB13287.1 hypothetical protein A6A11_06520 [Bisgaardia hudsonensis]TCP10968.1 lipopolysaccharide biosynthesis protein WzzE [Bisgaardia hudsonensis]
MKKIIIVFISIIFWGLIGLSSSYIIKPSWITEAEIEKPQTNSLGNYYALFSMYHLLIGKVDEIDKINNIVYTELNHQISSYDVRREFWEQSDYYKQKLTGDKKTDLMLLDKLIESITYTFYPNTNVISIRIELDNPKQSFDLLVKFIEKINLNTRENVYSNLIYKWKVLFEQVNLASQLKLGQIQDKDKVVSQDWLGKLNMMKSVTPLDNKLIAYHYIKQPRIPILSIPNHLHWTIYGGILGLFFGFVLLFFMRRNR